MKRYILLLALLASATLALASCANQGGGSPSGAGGAGPATPSNAGSNGTGTPSGGGGAGHGG